MLVDSRSPAVEGPLAAADPAEVEAAVLSLAVPALLLWFLLGGPVMQLASSDHVVKNWMVPIMGLVFADAVVKISRLSRPRPPQAGFAAPPLAR